MHLDIRADKCTSSYSRDTMNRLELKTDICWTDWYMNGWGNPNCQGSFLWAYQGNGNACVNVPAMAASVSFGISPGVAELGLVNLPTCGLARSALVAGTPDATTSDFSPTVQLIEVNGDGDSGLEKRQVHTSCNNSKEGVWAFRIRWV